MSNLHSVIFWIKPSFTIIDTATEIQETLGLGGNPAPDVIEEERIGYCCHPTTPCVINGETGLIGRASFDPAYGEALEYIRTTTGAETAVILEVEADGQTVCLFERPDGEMQELGYISNVSMHHEPVEVGNE